MPPPPTARVNDYAGVLAPAEAELLERHLAERERATGAQMVVAVFPSLQGESLEDFSIALAERWRVGRKGLDDGVILLVFVAERRVRLEVGYGLEPVIPDAVAGRIIGEAIAPRFKQGRYAAGLEAAAAAVYERIATGGEGARKRRGPDVGTVAMLLVFAVIVGFAVTSQVNAVRRRGYTAARGGWSAPRGLHRGRFGWGGGFSGGGGFPRGGGGGGFSGGGGSFGGGGASGSW